MGDLERRVVRGAAEVPGADVLHGPRACDSDRNRYIHHLAKCHQLGYIQSGVFTARMEAAAECVTQDQLAALTSDLPAPVPPQAKLRDRIKGLGRTALGRRWLHICAAAAALCWAVVIPMLIFTETGYAVVYGTGKDAWEQTQHPGLAIAAMFFFIITGAVGLIADLGWWIHYEDAF